MEVDHVEKFVDKKLIELLKACSLLKYPEMDSLKEKFVTFGPK